MASEFHPIPQGKSRPIVKVRVPVQIRADRRSQSFLPVLVLVPLAYSFRKVDEFNRLMQVGRKKLEIRGACCLSCYASHISTCSRVVQLLSARCSSPTSSPSQFIVSNSCRLTHRIAARSDP